MKERKMKRIRGLLLFFMIALFLSGLTAIPIDAELSWLLKTFPGNNLFQAWISRVLSAYTGIKEAHPFLLYGYDWLAFAHFILAILFIGPYRDPVRNIWVIQFGLIACVLVFPLAFIAGALRGIPFGWQLIDCSFGFFGFTLLRLCYSQTKQLIPVNI